MEIFVEKDYEGMSLRAAQMVAIEIKRKRQIVLGLASGNTPLGLYKYWIRMVQQGNLSFKGVTSFNLDEYLGLAPQHPQSYWTYMQENLFCQIDIEPEHVHIPHGDVEDVAAHCLAYEQLIRQVGGIDIQILGIGQNGHIGFNEPGGRFGNSTHLVELTEGTRQVNSRYFLQGEDVPTHAITMGLKSIMNAKQIVLLAAGENKSDAVYKAIMEEVSSELPASVLQLHPNCVFILDEEAASRLPASVQGKREVAR